MNVILAQTLNFCFADVAKIPFLIVKSFIRREDSIAEDKSYFFAEIEGILSFLKLSKDRWRYLFVIDEIFRGTNTIERVAIATSVIEEFTQNSNVFITTHDIELQELLNGKLSIFHFSEQVDDNNYYFKLR